MFCIITLFQYFKESTASRLELNYKTLVSMNSYVDHCVELIWYMCVQDPAMILRWPDPDDVMDPTIMLYGLPCTYMKLDQC